MQRITQEELKEILLEALLRFDEFCKENKIIYTLAYGTALGAIRHKGFIPWDDDIDVIMTRAEYNKFEKAWKKYASSNEEIYTLWGEMDEENYYLGFCAKFFDTRTILYESLSRGRIIEYGIFIDIFIVDHIPVEAKEQIKILQKNLTYRKWMRFFQIYLRKYNQIVKKHQLPLFSLKNLIKNFLEFKDKCNKQNTPMVSMMQDYDKITKQNKSMYQSSWFNQIKLVEFQGYYFPIIKSYDEMLRSNYGDYMQLPPEIERVGHNIVAYWK